MTSNTILGTQQQTPIIRNGGYTEDLREILQEITLLSKNGSNQTLLVCNEPAVTFCKLCLFSHYIQNKLDKSVSGNLIAEPELFKTKALQYFFKIKGVAVETDITYMGLIQHVLPKIETGMIKTIIVPDMVKTIMKKQATMQNLIGILNGLLEEGIYDITLRDTRDFHGARANMLTSMTPTLLYQNKLLWNRMGFLSRLLPFSYKYTEQKNEKILRAIEKGSVVEPQPIELNLPEFKVEVELSESVAEKLRPLVDHLTETERAKIKMKNNPYPELTQKSAGFRHQHQFQSLLRASALSRGNKVVDGDDLKEIFRIGNWINYDFNVL
jgi:hypothetical protein